MNKTTTSAALALLASAGFAQVPTFTQVARYNLGSLGTNNVPMAVAFDGANAYVASASTGAAGTRLVKIAGALTPTGQTPTVFATQATAAGTSRAASLIAANNSIYWGYGLGDGGSAWGVARYNPDGTLNTGFGSGGVVNSAATFISNNGAAANTRIDSIDLDPVTGRIGAVAFNSGFVFEIDAATGANVPNSALKFGAAGAGSTSWRDISFDAQGNLYARTKGGVTVRRWTRNGNAFDAGADIATLGTGTGGSPYRVEAVNGTGFDAFVMGNSYNVATPGVSILNPLTGASLGTLTGTEDGLGTAFGTSGGLGSFMGLSSATVGGSTYVFVAAVATGGTNTLAVYRVNAVPEPASLLALGAGALALARRRRRA